MADSPLEYPHSQDTPDLELFRDKMNQGKELDVLCTAGRRGGTAFMPASTRQPIEVSHALGVSAHYIPTGTEGTVRKKELKNPRTIPILEYSPNAPHHYWKAAQAYEKRHKHDTAPRLFAMADAEHVKHFLNSQRTALGGEVTIENLEQFRAIDLPLFVSVKNRGEIKTLFDKRERGILQGIILNNRGYIEEALEAWSTWQSNREYPALHARPFIGLRGTSEELLRFMQTMGRTDQEVDTLVFRDSPDIDTAEQIRKLHRSRMLRKKAAQALDNPFHEDARPEQVTIAVLNVQGAARKDATALLEASAGVTQFNVNVFMVENGEQLRTLRPQGLVLPGGWHGIQYALQKDLGLQDEIIKHIRDKQHVLALCAGSIQTRASDTDLDEIKSEGCEVGTTIGIGNYKIFNNALSTPRDIHVCVHARDPNDPKSRILHQVSLSNAPHYIGVDRDQMNVIARLVTDDRALDIEDDSGEVVGLQVKQRRDTDPVQIAAAFHDQFIFLLFLHELGLYKLRVMHELEYLEQEHKYYLKETTLLA